MNAIYLILNKVNHIFNKTFLYNYKFIIYITYAFNLKLHDILYVKLTNLYKKFAYVEPSPDNCNN